MTRWLKDMIWGPATRRARPPVPVAAKVDADGLGPDCLGGGQYEVKELSPGEFAQLLGKRPWPSAKK